MMFCAGNYRVNQQMTFGSNVAVETPFQADATMLQQNFPTIY
jgi:hypothetical protein